jgi:phage tail sheath protein FI
MPEYLAPGVYVEEVPSSPTPIEGVSTSTCGLVGPCCGGPLNGPVLVTSLKDFELVFGGGAGLHFGGASQADVPNFMWHAVRAFYAQGGTRLYVMRLFRRLMARVPGLHLDGCARKRLGSGNRALHMRARFPGAAGNVRIQVTLCAQKQRKHLDKKAFTASVTVSQMAYGSMLIWEGLALEPPDGHRRKSEFDSLLGKFQEDSLCPGLGLTVPIVIMPGSEVRSRLDIVRVFCACVPTLKDALNDPNSTDAERSVDIQLEGGHDGSRPTAAEYGGEADQNNGHRTGLAAFEDIKDISILAAPGYSFGYETNYDNEADSIMNLLIAHATVRHRIVVLDSGDAQSIDAVRAMRSKIDSTYAAFHYPWLKVLDPTTGMDIFLPPSGFVAGIYAHTDTRRGVFNAPADEAVNLAIGLEQTLDNTQLNLLNSEGINCFRFFEGRGFRLWGARTATSDPEWKYVNVRRYLIYLERSIDQGTRWTVFEPNTEPLWANVQRRIEDFLFNEWKAGGLHGDKPEKAFFVRCDRTTMTQDDLDNGRLILTIGVAPLRPAEFVIFRIARWTAHRKKE